MLRTLALAVASASLPEKTWRAAARAHERRVHDLLAPGLEVSGGGFSGLQPQHPVYNFLKDYYGVRGRKGTRRLARYSPGPGVLLLGATEADLAGAAASEGAAATEAEVAGGCGLAAGGAVFRDGGLVYDAEAYMAARGPEGWRRYEWHREVIGATAAHRPVLDCYGLHEWAMVYQPEGAPTPPSLAYQSGNVPLRVSRDAINAAVERQPLRCTHVDAVRFFAKAALPLNVHGDPPREQQAALEQPACVHASMDLLKYALAVAPFGESAACAGDALELALEARKLDMAASPYDVSAYGIAAVPIETEAGRAEYKRRQIALMKRAEPVRAALLAAYDVMLEARPAEGAARGAAA